MSSRVRFELDQLSSLQRAATDLDVETCAIGFVQRAGDDAVVGRLEEIPSDAYLRRSAESAVIEPRYVVEVVNEARRINAGLCFAHTHPGNGRARFSTIDDDGERELSGFLQARLPDRPHLALVASQGSVQCRWLAGATLPTIGVGRTITVWNTGGTGVIAGDDSDLRYDRQVRVFGPAAQMRLSELRVGIVGLGGTGSIVATELAHLGVQNLLVVDPDEVESSNLNRLVGATAASVGSSKVDVASASTRRINSRAQVETISQDIVEDRWARKLVDVDVVFCCTDTHASRAVLNQIAYQYFIPTIDVGVAIHTSASGDISAVVGRVQLLAPGEPCLLCCGWIDSHQVRVEMQDDVTRSLDRYVVGEEVVQPAVISLNGTVSSLAVTMFLGVAAGIPTDARWLQYDALRGTVRPMVATAAPGCVVCSALGARARGDSWELPTRRSVP